MLPALNWTAAFFSPVELDCGIVLSIGAGVPTFSVVAELECKFDRPLHEGTDLFIKRPTSLSWMVVATSVKYAEAAKRVAEVVNLLVKWST